MLREIVIPHSENYYIKIPSEYIDKEVEILVLPTDTNKGKDNMNNDLLKKQKKLTAISLDTKHFEFNRNEANERKGIYRYKYLTVCILRNRTK